MEVLVTYSEPVWERITMVTGTGRRGITTNAILEGAEKGHVMYAEPIGNERKL